MSQVNVFANQVFTLCSCQSLDGQGIQDVAFHLAVANQVISGTGKGHACPSSACSSDESTTVVDRFRSLLGGKSHPEELEPIAASRRWHTCHMFARQGFLVAGYLV